VSMLVVTKVGHQRHDFAERTEGGSGVRNQAAHSVPFAGRSSSVYHMEEDHDVSGKQAVQIRRVVGSVVVACMDSVSLVTETSAKI
jgi:hypothetical protein